jgi:hypothetical protein
MRLARRAVAADLAEPLHQAVGAAAGEGSAAEDGDITMAGDAVDDDDDDDDGGDDGDGDSAWHGKVSAADVDSLFRPGLPDFSRKPRIVPGASDAPRRKASRGHSGDGVGASSQAFVAARTPRSLPLSGDGAPLGGAHEATDVVFQMRSASF